VSAVAAKESRVYHKLIQTLRSRGLVPAALVTFALAAALLAPPVGAALRPFMTGSYPCTAVSLTASPAASTTAGTQVLLTASATCPSPSPSYEFWAEWQGTTSYVLIQSYSTTATYNWNSSGAATGTEHFGVWARDSTSSAAYDVFTSISYAITGPAASGSCASVTEAANPASPQFSGTQITFTGTGVTCTNPNPAFEFWMRAASQSNWQLLQGWSTAPYHWNSTGAAAGVVNFGVWVKDAGSTAAYDAVVNLPFTVKTPNCASVTVAAVPTAVTGGVHSVITATPGACTNPSPSYEFWAKWAGTSNWVLVQGWGTSASYNWDSHGAAAGVEQFGAWIRDAASTATYDAFSATPASVTVS
jgi:hypothetical protein